MAIALVGNANVDTAITGTSHTFTYASTGGNWLTMCLYLNNGAGASPVLASITDTAANTWNFSASTAASPPTQGWFDSVNFDDEATIVAWAATAAAVASVTVTVNAANFTGCGMLGTLAEWSGVGSVDSANISTGTAAGGIYQTGSITTSSGNDVVILANGGSAFANSPPSGFSQFPSFVFNEVGYMPPGTVPAGSHHLTFGGVTGNQYGTAALALAPFVPPPPPARVAALDLGEEERRGFWKKALLVEA